MVIPRTVGKYEIVDAIGSGGMGTVYRAFDPTLERTVALKVVHLDRVQEFTPQEFSERFRNEARAVARLNHPAIVTIFDYDERDPAGPYIAMEYIQGCALDEYVKQRPELHLEDAVSAMHQVLSGLAYAHGRNVVHRDIKPSNLLVTRDGLVKITDFGIAKIGPRTQTQTAFQVGTPQYMAPEQYMGGVVDHRCDIHAAGVVLYELLAGFPPYTGTSAEVMYKICHETPKPLSSVDPSIPQVFDAIIAQALEKLPANRYASAADFQHALRSSWQAISPKPPSPTLSQRAQMIVTIISRITQPPPVAQQSAARADVAPASTPVTGAALSDASPPPDPTPKAAALLDTGGQGSLVAWSREQLLEIERQLIPLVGPLARILVRDAAATTASRQELYRLLASHLQSPEERRRFLAGERSSTGSGAATASGTSEAIQTPGLSRGQPLTPDMTQRASQLLARYLGPIAGVVTRRAAQTATDEAHLYSILAEKVTDSAERERFLIEAGRGR
jgi:eukaryotic-like serine/threonine-protein kinase